MRLQVCRMVYEEAEGIGPEDVVSLEEAGRILGIIKDLYFFALWITEGCFIRIIGCVDDIDR